MKIFEEFLAEIRKFGGLKVSRLSKVPQQTIYNWTQGRSIPNIVVAQQVADAMGLEFLLFEKE